jgi:hypothetical protein
VAAAALEALAVAAVAVVVQAAAGNKFRT